MKAIAKVAGLSVVASTFILAGCSGGSKPAATADPTKPEKLTNLVVWARMVPQAALSIKSYNENEVYKEMEKATGVKVDFQHPPQGQEKEQFNLMMTSGKLPDVIEYAWSTFPGGPEKAIKDNKIIKLNDLVDKYAPNFKKLLDSHPDWKKQALTDEGSLFSFPFIRGEKGLQVYQGITVRKDWLDKLGLQMPTTIDEWYTVLKAFKEKDPNGNGKADEVPLLVTLNDFNKTHVFVGAWGLTNSFYKDGGKVKFGPIEPNYKEFLTTMNKWYKEGLIDKDFAATDGKVTDAKVTGNQLGTAIMATGGGIGKYMGLMASKNKDFKLGAAPYPTLVKGQKPELGHSDYAVTAQGSAISINNKNPIETVKWLDYGYGEVGHMLFNFGKEDVSYKMEKGYPKFTDLITKNPEGMPMQQAMVKYNRAGYGEGPFVQDIRYMDQYASSPEQQESLKIWTQPSNEKMMPLVTPTKEESSKFASTMTDINTYKDEMIIKFIMGAEPLSSFDAYVKTIKGMGIDDAIKVQQAALERYNNRK
ncbi:ABC transporter substrate-binding protein [Paenibacillus radicis (ex Xue et al. 2023)]